MLLVTVAATAQNKVGAFSIKPMAGLNTSNFGSPTYDIYKTRYVRSLRFFNEVGKLYKFCDGELFGAGGHEGMA